MAVAAIEAAAVIAAAADRPAGGAGSRPVQVIAFSTPLNPAWRWRIVSYSGDQIEESREEFGTIGAALAKGWRRLRELDIVDRTVAPARFRPSGRR